MKSLDIDWLVQKKIYEEIKNSPGLQTFFNSDVRVYDEVPQDVVFPFITLGESRLTSLDGLQDYFQHDVKIQVYSRYGGRREVKNIMSILKDVMQVSNFDLGSGGYTNLFFVFSDILNKSDRGIYRGIMKFKIHTCLGSEIVV